MGETLSVVGYNAYPTEDFPLAPLSLRVPLMYEGSPFVPTPVLVAGSRFTPARLGWLIRLRWIALWGILVSTLLVVAGAFEGVRLSVVIATLVAAVVYNTLLWDSHRRGTASTGDRAAMAQALADFLILTMILWASGGLSCPFIFYYVFHVALAGLLAGPRAAWFSAALALGCVGWLGVVDLFPALQIGAWQPVGHWQTIGEGVALVSTLAVMAYLVSHAATELGDRERALQDARDRAQLEYEMLSNTLNELDAGLEVLGPDRTVVFRNRLAREIAPEGDQAWSCPGGEDGCERAVASACPLTLSLEYHRSGRCRFGVQRDGAERLYELHSFPLSPATEGQPRVMNLYVDRTAATLAERQLVLAERLASLGRVTQGVAHELNTPLATIQTLSADMADALTELGGSVAERQELLLKDVNESAALIREETARLGRITQSLLAGGDLVRARVRGPVSLAALVERAVALVFVGMRSANRVSVSQSVQGITMLVDPDRLVQVLVNLLSNAYDAVREMDERERGSSTALVYVRVRLNTSGAIELHVDDDGPGLDNSVLGRLFEPFATTKPPGQGTGLGLYTSYMLVNAMKGSLFLRNRTEGGTRATIVLPPAAVLSHDVQGVRP